MPVLVNRQPIRFRPDPGRIALRYFSGGDEQQARVLVRRILDMPEKDVGDAANQALRMNSHRHRNISRVFTDHFDMIRPLLSELNVDPENLSLKRRLLLGAYFTREISIESTAFFNPCIMEDPQQGDLGDNGTKRIIMSFRASGKGDLSSIVFRGGVIDRDNRVLFSEAGPLSNSPETVSHNFHQKQDFLRKLKELDIPRSFVQPVLQRLSDVFSFDELRKAIHDSSSSGEIPSGGLNALQTICWIANSEYELNFSFDTAISERVIFSNSASESGGIEDARFVRFTDDNGDVVWRAVCTVFNGFVTLSKLLETQDFYRFRISPIHGEYTRNRGLALFPRPIRGRCAMMGNDGGVNQYIMYSEDILRWRNVAPVDITLNPWEFVRMGNCGSPLETEKGWLVITHGVGPMRGFSLGAVLLDLDDPSRVIGHLSEPLLTPAEDERDGFVPNVLYSSGAVIHDRKLFLPYSAAETFSSLAVIELDELLDALCRSCPGGARSKPPVEHRPSVLVVDDEPVIRKFIAQLLSEEGYDVEMAGDGAEALLSIGGKHFDIILLDVNMPMLDGFQFMSVLRKRNIEARIVVLSGDERENLEDRGLPADIEFLHKPVRAMALLEMVKRLTPGRPAEPEALPDN